MSDAGEGATRSFRPGAWFGIFGDRASVVLPPSEKARVAALWELVDDGAGFEEVLDALIADGLRELPGFVLVSERDGETRVVLRGAARATFVTDDETVELEGSGATTWVERSLPGVRRMRIQVGEVAVGADHTISGGLVRLARVDQPPHPRDLPGRVEGEASPVGEDAAGEEGGAEDEPPAEELPTEAVDIPATWDSPPPWNPPMPPESPMPSTPVPAGPSGASAGGQPAPAVARLAFSTGETVEVDRAVLIGRSPEPGRHPTTGRPRLVAVPSPHQEISSTHVEVRPGAGVEHGSAVVTDLGSTNGTVLVQPGLPPEDLLAGITVPLLPGAILDLGDGVTIRVSTP